MPDQNSKQERHQARQQKVKEQIDAKVAAAQEEKGLLLVITGNGKGKSTSGFGTIAALLAMASNVQSPSSLKERGITVSVTC